MDKQFFVQNVKMYCQQKGVKPTVACRESGVGTSFINNIEARGQVPSVEKVQLLAQYLGVSTSDLLGEKPTGPGEKKEPAPVSGDRPLYPPEYDLLTPEDKELVNGMIRSLARKKSAD